MPRRASNPPSAGQNRRLVSLHVDFQHPYRRIPDHVVQPLGANSYPAVTLCDSRQPVVLVAACVLH